MNRLKSLRKEVGLSLRSVEEKTGISNPVLSCLENGKRPFRQEHIVILTSFFNVTSDYLLGRTDFGLIVVPEFGAEELTLTEGEYKRLHEHISVTVIPNVGASALTLRIDTPLESQDIFVPTSVVYREIKGSISDYDLQETLGNKLAELAKRMTSEELDRAIRFIEEYILHK